MDKYFCKRFTKKDLDKYKLTKQDIIKLIQQEGRCKTIDNIVNILYFVNEFGFKKKEFTDNLLIQINCELKKNNLEIPDDIKNKIEERIIINKVEELLGEKYILIY